MSTESDTYDPDACEGTLVVELREMYETLRTKHARRKRSPLIFVETYQFTETEARRFERSGWDSVERELGHLKGLLERLKPDYQSCFGAAEAQRGRNKVWDQIYGAPPPFLGGGRADGNS